MVSKRFLNVLAATAILWMACACSTGPANSGGGKSDPPPTQQPAATPAITPATGTFSAAQTVSISDSTQGATIYYTIDGSTPTTSSTAFTKSFTVSATTTVNAIATASGYTTSAMATSKITINEPDAISLPATMTLNPGDQVAVDSKIVTASGTCSPSSGRVSWSFVPADGDAAINNTVKFPWVAPDTTNATWGTLYSGNTFTEKGGNIWNVTAVCGTASSTMVLTVTDVRPTITGVSPTTVDASATQDTWTITGTGYIAGNDNSLTTWSGTMATTHLGPCPATMYAGVLWEDFTKIGQSSSNSGGITPGSWSYQVYNPPTEAGTGGGTDCMNNAFTAVSNSSGSSQFDGSTVLATVTPGTKTQPGSLTTVFNNQAKTYALGRGAIGVAISDGRVIVPSRWDNSVNVLDVETGVMDSIALDGWHPLVAVADSNGTIYATAQSAKDENSFAVFRLAKDRAPEQVASSASEPRGLLTDSQNRVLWVETANNQSILRRYDPNSGGFENLRLSTQANALALTENGNILVYPFGEKQGIVVDAQDFSEIGKISMPAGLWFVHNDTASFADGTVRSLSLNIGGDGSPQANWALRATPGVQSMINGFAVEKGSFGPAVLYTNSTRGALAASQLK